jgi:hypothetical protein
MLVRRVVCALVIFSGMAHAAPPAGYQLAWQDEFDGTALDSTKWGYRTDTRFWSKQLPANVSVSGGFLNLHLKKEAVDSVQYTAGGVTFDQAGAYLLELAATGAFAETSRTLLVNVAPDPATLSGWQSLTWPGVSDPNIISAAMDPDKDGLNNLLEWALHLDATIPSTFRPALTQNTTELQYTYTRRKTAPGEAVFQIEWSDTLANSWSNFGVIENPSVVLTSSTESVTARCPAGFAGKRFLRLKVSITYL